jgi:hypothetical protein
MKDKGIVCNITINSKSLVGNWIDCLPYVHGVGISLGNEPSEKTLELIKYALNPVIHVIAGVTPLSVIEQLYDRNISLLILGYKQVRFGVTYYNTNASDIDSTHVKWYTELPKILTRFKTVSFDNLAISQLNVRRLFTTDEWDEFYMGDDGQFTMYVGLVNNVYARSSTSIEKFDIKSNIRDMFNHIRTL